MAGVDPFPALPVAAADPPAQHAEVLEVVDALQQQHRHERLQRGVGQDRRPQPDGERRPQDGRHQPGVEHVVAEAPRRAGESGVSAPLQPPGAAHRPDDRARPVAVDRLAEPRAGRVLGGGDADVVAAVVLDVEVAVAAPGEGDLGQPALHALALVPQLVGGVDADPADAAEGDGQPDLVDRGEVGAGDRGHACDQAGVLHGQEGVGDPAVAPTVPPLLGRGRTHRPAAGEIHGSLPIRMGVWSGRYGAHGSPTRNPVSSRWPPDGPPHRVIMMAWVGSARPRTASW